MGTRVSVKYLTPRPKKIIILEIRIFVYLALVSGVWRNYVTPRFLLSGERYHMKEKLWQSERFKAVIAAIVLELVLLLLGQLDLDIDTELLKTVSNAIAGLIIAFVIGRTYRNTSGGIDDSGS